MTDLTETICLVLLQRWKARFTRLLSSGYSARPKGGLWRNISDVTLGLFNAGDASEADALEAYLSWPHKGTAFCRVTDEDLLVGHAT
jgi:hypothetical protein